MTTIGRLWWAWKNRCRRVRMSSAVLPTAYLAQHYLASLKCKYEPCRVCGSATCSNAKKRPVPIPMPESKVAWLNQLARRDRRRSSP